MTEFYWASEVLPFTVAILVMISIALVEGVGMLFGAAISSAVDSIFPDFNIDVDIPDIEQNGLTKLLSWLNFGKVPVLVIFICFLTSFGLSGLIVQSLIHGIFNTLLPLIIAIPISFLIAMPFTKSFTSLIQKIMPQDESSAISKDDFIGGVATITIGKASLGSPAEARYTDRYKQTHYVMVEPENDEVFETGENVLLAKHTPKGFYAIKNNNEKLID